MHLFVGDGAQQVIDFGHEYLIVNGSCYWILSFLFIFRYTLQGLGQSIVPTIAGIMELLMRTAAALFLCDWLATSAPAWPTRWPGLAPACRLPSPSTGRTGASRKNIISPDALLAGLAGFRQFLSKRNYNNKPIVEKGIQEGMDSKCIRMSTNAGRLPTSWTSI